MMTNGLGEAQRAFDDAYEAWVLAWDKAYGALATPSDLTAKIEQGKAHDALDALLALRKARAASIQRIDAHAVHDFNDES
jgi:hypothetical protein